MCPAIIFLTDNSSCCGLCATFLTHSLSGILHWNFTFWIISNTSRKNAELTRSIKPDYLVYFWRREWIFVRPSFTSQEFGCSDVFVFYNFYFSGMILLIFLQWLRSGILCGSILDVQFLIYVLFQGTEKFVCFFVVFLNFLIFKCCFRKISLR